jgi:hypothetical protein
MTILHGDVGDLGPESAVEAVVDPGDERAYDQKRDASVVESVDRVF